MLRIPFCQHPPGDYGVLGDCVWGSALVCLNKLNLSHLEAVIGRDAVVLVKFGRDWEGCCTSCETRP